MLLPVFMVLYGSITVLLLHLAEDNQMDAYFQAEIASTGD